MAMPGRQPVDIESACDHRRGGQAMLEYLVVATALIATMSIIAVFLYTFREHAGRVLDMVAADYP